MKTIPFAIVVSLACAITASAQDVLPTDHGKRELRERGHVYTPIRHQKYYRGERELFGYNPRFTPNVVTFDRDNRPHIRHGAIVQTISGDGRWIGLDMSDSIRAVYPAWDGEIRQGPGIEERVVFDAAGDAYTTADLTRCNVGNMLLLHSRDGCRTWDVHVLPEHSYFIEHDNGFNQIIGPPVLARGRGGVFNIIVPTKMGDGSLNVPAPIKIADGECWTTPYHSGASNVTLTRDGKTHIVWIDVSAPSGHETLADIYIATYDHDSGEIEGPLLLGYSERDNHNGPVAAMDSKGVIHVLIGRHAYPFPYTYSLEPNTIAGGFTEPVEIGHQKRSFGEGGYTYTALACDRNDTLHLAARWSGQDYAKHIGYLRKKPGEQWVHESSLVIPFRNYYSVWYHKFGLDRQGRLFMNYFYYGTGLTPAAARAYKAKWPDETDFVIPENPETHVNGIRTTVTYHDPAMVMTDDGGDTWRIALTEDFVQAIDRPLATNASLPGTVTNSVGMQMQLIQPGDFIMGDDGGDFDEQPAHAVRISEPFYIGRHEVTVAQFRRFMEASGYRTVQDRTDFARWYGWLSGGFSANPDVSWRNPDYEQTDDHPVTCLMRVDAQAFCDWLSETEGATYRLPTEAQWEYACRAGTTTQYSFGDSNMLVGAYGWYVDNSDARAHPVGLKKPNPWGLYDMHGNLAEWVSDEYDLYPHGRLTNPTGPAMMPDEPKPIIRGGSWLDDAHGPDRAYNLRSAARYYIYFPQIQVNWVGFRVVRKVQ
jgi:formylglycine-generating enzyme required for sulfatase activity